MGLRTWSLRAYPMEAYLKILFSIDITLDIIYRSQLYHYVEKSSAIWKNPYAIWKYNIRSRKETKKTDSNDFNLSIFILVLQHSNAFKLRVCFASQLLLCLNLFLFGAICDKFYHLSFKFFSIPKGDMLLFTIFIVQDTLYDRRKRKSISQ